MAKNGFLRAHVASGMRNICAAERGWGYQRSFTIAAEVAGTLRTIPPVLFGVKGFQWPTQGRRW